VPYYTIFDLFKATHLPIFQTIVRDHWSLRDATFLIILGWVNWEFGHSMGLVVTRWQRLLKYDLLSKNLIYHSYPHTWMCWELLHILICSEFDLILQWWPSATWNYRILFSWSSSSRSPSNIKYLSWQTAYHTTPFDFWCFEKIPNAYEPVFLRLLWRAGLEVSNMSDYRTPKATSCTAA